MKKPKKEERQHGVSAKEEGESLAASWAHLQELDEKLAHIDKVTRVIKSQKPENN